MNNLSRILRVELQGDKKCEIGDKILRERMNYVCDSVTSAVHCNMHALEVSRTFKIFIIIKFLEHSRVTKL